MHLSLQFSISSVLLSLSPPLPLPLVFYLHSPLSPPFSLSGLFTKGKGQKTLIFLLVMTILLVDVERGSTVIKSIPMKASKSGFLASMLALMLSKLWPLSAMSLCNYKYILHMSKVLLKGRRKTKNLINKKIKIMM